MSSSTLSGILDRLTGMSTQQQIHITRATKVKVQSNSPPKEVVILAFPAKPLGSASQNFSKTHHVT